MKICSSDMNRSALIMLMLNSFCAFSYVPHEVTYFVGCFVNGTTEVQFEFDAAEILYVDFQKEEAVYTVPKFVDPDPSQVLAGLSIIRDALTNKDLCLAITAGCAAAENNPPEEKEEVQLGVNNTLTCFVNHFYPPDIKVSWTKNGRPLSEGVSLSRYFPNNDQTFHQFSTLTFTPTEEDIYSCTVEHSALDRPITRIWAFSTEPEFSQPSLTPDIVFGVGMAVALLGIAVGVFLIAKAHYEQNSLSH
ncbi:II histocompatibility antigen, B alpha chain RT1 class [Collichthys lucidus]|uniref:II histocompatibility antigen, B alpha chain RT1 class n=1 Tax=Collichthys lucidus TaxID=240159 RepID=A0A4U5V470_COLLU|nr:II histocompatibility antigen, B alpha chain RT1 class [Collichthys lucidus]